MRSNDKPVNATQTENHISRRDFLGLAGKTLLALSGVLGLGGLLHFLSFQPDPPPKTKFDLGPASQYPLGSRTVITEASAILLSTAGGFSAYSLVCPHLGCTIEVETDAYACPCHGSRFDFTGEIINGPAKQPLRQLRLEETEAGELILFTD